MTKDDMKQVLGVLRELAKTDDVIAIYLKYAEVEARAELIGQKASQEFIDDSIIANGLKDLLITVLGVQSSLLGLRLSDELSPH